MSDEKSQAIAIVGGSVSGSEAAQILAEKGYKVVVFEMNALPYGKIEDGLPSWHIGLRDRQERMIDDKLDHPNIQFIPNFKIGKDISFEELLTDWGFRIVIIANGAWKDRSLGIPGIEEFEGKQIVYQNPFVHWFNHKHQPDYTGPQYDIKNNAIVVGGGLASIDMVKIIMMERVKAGLKEHKNIDIGLFQIEKKGVKATLEAHGLSLEAIKVEPATLVYRRNAEAMPLSSPRNNSPEAIEKAQQVSLKLLNKNIEKYMIRFEPCCVLKEAIIEDGKFEGLVFNKVEVEGRKLIPTDNDIELRSQFVVSSIGSIPEKIAGLEYAGERLKIAEGEECRVDAYDNVFAIGNAVTGRGNIRESKKHGQEMTGKIVDEHLEGKEGTIDALENKLETHNQAVRGSVVEQIENIESQMAQVPVQTQVQLKAAAGKIQGIYEKIGYKGYRQWIADHIPVRLEDLEGE